ncbi:putative ABC transport system permease protein [Streptomyces sp. SceaMP-e96]|uniref:ABC transporter permease n=1 Tax=Streptomyces TaxID=1883 RepID=UPI000823C5B9|nr:MULTISPECIES: ABC transporter permease [unclassified Streptomyces]MYT13676.1 FtsX-like permease family protein [Streptomyces sp. SID4951]SCK53374.1 putative ABC transport system permease protein [Streptomyces sp. SceaMP-e96]
MLRTALRNVLAHKARLMMTALAVLLGVAFVAGTLIFSDTVGSAVKKASEKNLDGVAVSVQAEAADNSPDVGKDGKRTTLVDEKLADTIRALPGVESVRRNVNGTATVAGPDNVPLGHDWQNLAANFQPGKDGHDPRYPLLKGRGPAAGNEIALDEATAKASGRKIGDSVRLATDGPVLTKKLVGIVSTDDPQVTAGGSLTLFDTATAQKLFLHPGQFDELVIGAAPGADQQALTAKVSEVLPKDRATATSGTDLAAEQSKMVASQNEALSQTLLTFAGIALFVGVFIIANTFTMLISQRSREIALMRAIGASRRQVVRSVLAEAALLGLISSAVGFALGTGLAVGLRAVLEANGAGFPDGPVVISPAAVLSALGVGVVVTVLAAWLPSRKAAKIAPVEALNTVEAPPALRSLVLRNSLGAVITGLGIATMCYVSTLKDADDLPIAMVGGMLTLTGVIILAPLLSRPLVSLAGVVTTRLFGISGKLAKENTLRNPRRTAATASALMIGLTLITGMTVVGNSAGQAMDKMTAQGLKADYKIGATSSGLDPKLSQKVADVPGVEVAAPLRNTGFETPDSIMGLMGTDLSTIGKVAQLDFTSGSLKSAGGNDIAVSQKMAKMKGWHTGDTLDATFFDKKKAKLKIVGIYADNQLLGDSIGATSLAAPHQLVPMVESLLVKAQDGPSEGLEKQIRHTLGDSPLLKVQDHADLRKENAADIEMVLNVSYGLLGMAVIIAVVGVVNTLAMSVFERTREIGMLRAIGLARSGIKQMVRLESVVIALFGAGLGIAVGVFCSWAAGNLVSQGLPTYELLLPWGRLALFVLLAAAVGVLAALWPARRAARLNMLESIGAQ